AVFNFSARKISRRKTSQTDSDAHRRLQITIVTLVGLQNIQAVDDDVLLQKRREEQKISIADQRQPKDAVLAHDFDLSPKFADKIQPELLAWVRRWHPRDEKAARQATQRQRHQNHSRPYRPNVENLRQYPSRNRAHDDRQERA